MNRPQTDRQKLRDVQARALWVDDVIDALTRLEDDKPHCFNLHFDADVVAQALSKIEQAYDLLDGMADAMRDDDEP